jgi:uncharacterized protein
MTKWLLLGAIVVFAWYLWKHNRRTAEMRSAARPAGPQPMVRCAVCSVHLPRTEALPGPDGALYCCTEHRQRGGRG